MFWHAQWVSHYSSQISGGYTVLHRQDITKRYASIKERSITDVRHLHCLASARGSGISAIDGLSSIWRESRPEVAS